MERLSSRDADTYASGAAHSGEARMNVSGRTAALILLAAGGAGFLFALASSPGIPTPGEPNANANTVTIMVVAQNDAAEDGQ
jgi:hypothetical protein